MMMIIALAIIAALIYLFMRVRKLEQDVRELDTQLARSQTTRSIGTDSDRSEAKEASEHVAKHGEHTDREPSAAEDAARAQAESAAKTKDRGQ